MPGPQSRKVNPARVMYVDQEMLLNQVNLHPNTYMDSPCNVYATQAACCCNQVYNVVDLIDLGIAMKSYYAVSRIRTHALTHACTHTCTHKHLPLTK